MSGSGNSAPPNLPGATVGVLGSGQLGRMLALEARRLGYRVHVFSPEADSPTGQVADCEVLAPYDDLGAARSFAEGVDVVTLEFENIPEATARAVAERVPLRPGVEALCIAQNRIREKTFLSEHGFPVAPFQAVRSAEDLAEGIRRLGAPGVLKTAGMGYDGKGQVKIEGRSEVDAEGAGEVLAEAQAAWEKLGRREAVLESFVDFAKEASVVIARGLDGRVEHYGVIENGHRNHILDLSTAPAGVSEATAARAVEIAKGIAEGLEYVGVLCVELFVGEAGDLLVNEIAPRPHNSGHLTLDACVTSQFEQQLRAVCGLPLGSSRRHAYAAMANLLGDVWEAGEPRWGDALALPGVHLHLYGKAEARPGRKMGHLTVLDEGSAAEAARRAREARHLLNPSSD